MYILGDGQDTLIDCTQLGIYVASQTARPRLPLNLWQIVPEPLAFSEPDGRLEFLGPIFSDTLSSSCSSSITYLSVAVRRFMILS